MANEMRDRLIKDLRISKTEWLEKECDHETDKELVEYVADYLLDDGWIRPPCKVGETVYYIHETYWDKNYKDYVETKELKEDVVQIVECPELKTNLMLEVKEFDWDLFNNWLNGEIFLTKAEAEQKLKEMRGGNG